MAKVGRPPGSELLDFVKEDFIKLIKLGVPIRYACDGVGISEATYYQWMEWGKKNKSEQFVLFYRDVKRARADALKRNVAIVQKAAAKTWQAAAWFLERSFPEQFGRPNRPETVSNDDDDDTDTIKIIMPKKKKVE